MNLSQFLLILKARQKIAWIVFFVTVTTAVIVSLILPKNYMATTSVLLNYKGVDPVTGMTLPAQLMPGYMATQTDIIQSKKVALEVVSDLGLTKIPQIKEQFASEKGWSDINDWMADLLLKKLDVKPSKESSVIEISFTGVDPVFAATVANTFASAYIDVTLRLKVDPALKASKYFSDQIKTLRENLENAQERLAKYQQENGITSTDDRLDVEAARLNDLSTQLSMAQTQSIDASSRQSDANRSSNDSPDVAVNPVIQSLRISQSAAESKLAELGGRLSKNHPQYIAAEAELNKIKSQLEMETRRAVNSISGTAKINQQRLAELRTQVEQQKLKVLELNRLRSKLAVLEKDVMTAQTSLDTVNQRFNQTTIEGQSNQSDIAVLETATPPNKPSSPKLLLNIALSVVIGGVLALALSLLAEMLDRRIRGRDDLAELIDVPIFLIQSDDSKKNQKRLIASSNSTYRLTSSN